MKRLIRQEKLTANWITKGKNARFYPKNLSIEWGAGWGMVLVLD